MGLFSWQCAVCDKSIRSPYCINTSDAWMNDAVAVLADGTFYRGNYDGYGRLYLDDAKSFDERLFKLPFDDEAKFTLYHFRCWLSANKPSYTKPSPWAEDQGHFVDD